MGDMWSPNGPLVFCVNEPGKARKCFNDYVVPSAWSEIVQGGCERYYNERERERERFLWSIEVIKN